jgi:hypothetical protein
MLILFEIQDENWEDIEQSVKAFRCSWPSNILKPVVVAFGLTGGVSRSCCAGCRLPRPTWGLEVGGSDPAEAADVAALQNVLPRMWMQTIFHLFAGLLRP